MTRKTTVTCDGCGQEIGETPYMREQYLALVPLNKQQASGAVFAMERPPLIQGERHFCDFSCLAVWFEDRQ